MTLLALVGWFLAGVFMLKSYRADLDARYEKRRYASMIDSEIRKHRRRVLGADDPERRSRRERPDRVDRRPHG